MNNSLYSPGLFSKLIVVTGVWVFLLFFGTVQAIAGDTIRIPSILSVDGSDNLSQRPSISTDGGLVAFESSATNLINSDTNGFDDVFINDLNANLNQRASVDSGGFEALENSRLVDVNEDGTLVVFSSFAQLTPQDTNNEEDVYVRDIANASTDVFVYRPGLATIRVSVDSFGAEGNGNSSEASISANGNFVAFSSIASNLDPTDTTPAGWDVLGHDINLSTTAIVSSDGAGVQLDYAREPSINGNGRVIAFEAEYGDVFVKQINGPGFLQASVDSAGIVGNDGSFNPSLSLNGRVVSFHSVATNLDVLVPDTNGETDVFLHRN